MPTHRAPALPMPAVDALGSRLNAAVEEVLERDWAPLFVDPGLGGREFAFDDSGALFEALAWAYPHLTPACRERVQQRLREEWTRHPPFSRDARYALEAGAPREWFEVPVELRRRVGADLSPHPFGNLYVVELFATRCGEPQLVRQSWPRLKAAFDDFTGSGWRLDPARGDLFANRYLASLLAFSRLAEASGDALAARDARERAEKTARDLAAWWTRAAGRGTLQTFQSVSELDPFIGQGDGISLALAPHRHKLALFQDLTAEVADRLRQLAAPAVDSVWLTFSRISPTWALSGEERQVHFGENFVDPPDFAAGGFRALAWLRQASREELARQVDVPWCRADLNHVMKLALALQAER